MTLIKICGLKDPETAYLAAKEGARMVGIVRCPASKRYVPMESAQEIVQAIREGGASPVLVYLHEKGEVIESESKRLGVGIIQVYEQSQNLDPSLTVIYANCLPDLFRKDVDYHMIDSPDPGQGRAMDWHSVKVPENVRWILAGGLNPKNVLQALRLLHPYGVDVSSGVEIEGRKNSDLIKQFISEVKSYA